MKKKIISVCLIMVMVLSCVSFNVHASNSMKVCLADLGCVDYGRYTGNMGDSCVFNLDQNGLPGMDNQYYRNGNIGVDGTVYNNGFEVWIARWNYGDDISWAYKTIDINGNFSKLTGSTGLIKSYNTTDFDSTVYFYDEETLLYSVRMTPNNWKHDFEIDITGVEQLKVMIMDNEEKAGGTSFALYDLFLETENDITTEKSYNQNFSRFSPGWYIYPLSSDLVADGASCSLEITNVTDNVVEFVIEQIGRNYSPIYISSATAVVKNDLAVFNWSDTWGNSGNGELVFGDSYLKLTMKQTHTAEFNRSSLECEERIFYPETNDLIKNNIKVILNGRELSFDQPPIMENDRVMVPIRAIFEALGYGLEWNQDTQTAIATKGNNKLSVPEGLSGLYVDDEWLSFDVPNINVSGRILVPVRVVAQCAGAAVEWDGENQSVLINYDSITADKRVSILKYALFCDNHIKNIFTTEKYTYQTFYQDMYIDNIYSGIAVDLVAEYLVDEAANKDKYIDVITTLLNMADFTIEDNIEKQHEFDTYKTFGEYAWDVGEIMIGTISPEGNKKLEIIKSLIDADSEAINITIDSIGKYERLNKIQLETEYKMTILDILEEGSIDDNLTAACQEIRDAEKKKVLLELDILNESLTDVAEYLANDVLFKQMAFPLMKQSDAYANDETLKLIVDKGDDLYKKADDCLGALKTGFKLGLFAGDMILGTTDTINRVTEMKALATIRLSFGSNLASQLANPLDSSKNIDEAYEELINIIPLIKFVDNIHLRGEYCMYKLMSEDQQLFSLIYDLSGDNLENLNKWWDNTKSDLIWYDHKLSSICQ